MSVANGVEQCLEDAFGLWEDGFFQNGGVRNPAIQGADALNGGIQPFEALLCHEGGDLCPESAGSRFLGSDNETMSLANAFEDCLRVERVECADVDDLGAARFLAG